MWKETKHLGLYKNGKEYHLRVIVHHTYLDLHVRIRFGQGLT